MLPADRAALLVAHPGHELRLHGWMEQSRPVVFVLTDGSGRTHHSRLPPTTRVLERAGATRGAVYGRFTDAAVYQALLARDIAAFTDTAAEIAAALLE